MQASELASIIQDCKWADQWGEIVHHMEFECMEGQEDEDLIAELASKGYKLNAEEHFGGESLGDSYWNVFSVEHNGETTYFRLDGWYASYDGSHFDDYFGFYEVNKVPVQVFEWHKK